VVIVPIASGRYRLVVKDVERLGVPRSTPGTLKELRESAGRILGRDLGARNATWLARVGNASRLARAYRRGRILLAGTRRTFTRLRVGRGSTSVSRMR
jgi:FAD binding domain